MNPDAVLRMQLELAHSLKDADGMLADPERDITTDALALAGFVLDMDEWLRQGGRMPRAWKKDGNT